MFGQMNVESLLRLDNGQGRPAPELETAVARLLGLTEHPKVARWLQFPRSVLIFLVIPGDPESGAFRIYDRKKWNLVELCGRGGVCQKRITRR